MRAGRILVAVVILLVLAVAAFLLWSQQPEIAAADISTHREFEPATIAAGAQLAAIGNCDVCHTVADGPPYAGARPIPTPFGTIYSSNITPDPETGIGRWPEAALRRALRDGISRDGTHLYPAFPYDHYTKLSDGDIHALYAFLMTRAPVYNHPPPNQLGFPFDQRWIMAGWNLLNLDRTPVRDNPQRDAGWNRGAYLAEALGHCGSCHTPRNWLAAEQKGAAYSGGTGEGWVAPALNAASPAPVAWDREHLLTYLKDGMDPIHGAAAGPMEPITEDLSRVDEVDARAIATYIESLQGDVPPQRRAAAAQLLAQVTHRVAQPVSFQSNDLGATLFAGACAGCHTGGPPLEPPRGIDLALSSAINAPDPTDAIRIVLEGIRPPPEQRGPWMPGFAGAFTDVQLTALLAHLRAQDSHRPAWRNLEGRIRDIREGKTPS